MTLREWLRKEAAHREALDEDAARQAVSLPKPLRLLPPTQDIGEQGNGQQGGTQGRERAAAMARHPAGKGRQAGLTLV